MLHATLTRFYGHFEGDAMTYRAADEIARLRAEKDSLKIFRAKVGPGGTASPGDFDAVDAEVTAAIDAAVLAAETDAPPTEADLLTDVYVSY